MPNVKANGTSETKRTRKSRYSTCDSPPAPSVPEVELGGFSFMATPRANKAPQPDTLLLPVTAALRTTVSTTQLSRGWRTSRSTSRCWRLRARSPRLAPIHYWARGLAIYQAPSWTRTGGRTTCRFPVLSFQVWDATFSALRKQ